MKLAMAEIFNAKEPLEELAKVKLPVKSSLAVMKLVRKLNDHLIPAQEVQNGLVKQYAEPPADSSQQISIKPGDKNWIKFAEELSELMAQEIEIVFDKIILPSELEIEPRILMALEKFIKM